MFRFKTDIFSLLFACGTLAAGTANAVTPAPVRAFVEFDGVAISQNQYLGLSLTNLSTTATAVCNVDIVVTGADGLPVATQPAVQTVAAGQTVFLPVTDSTPPGNNAPVPPQYVHISIYPDSMQTSGADNCNRGDASLGVYDRTSNDLQLLINKSAKEQYRKPPEHKHDSHQNGAANTGANRH